MKETEKLRRVDSLTIENVRRVFDVAYDVHSQLNLAPSAKVTIAAAPQNVKFRELLPYSTPQQLDAYEAGRRQGLAFLKEVGAIADFRVIDPAAQRIKRQIEVTMPSNTQPLNDLVDRLRSRLTPQAARQPAAATLSELSYDADTNLLRYGNKVVSIRNHTIQHCVCALVANSPSAKVPELEILDEYDKAKGTEADHRNRAVYDACIALNTKTEKAFGIKPFKYEGAEVWIDFNHTTPVE